MPKNPSAQYERWLEPTRGSILALRNVLLDLGEEISETSKYGMPCFLYRSKIFCYLWADKATNEPYLLFAEGRQMTHPSLETGDRKRMKILRINPNEDLPLSLINSVLTEAIQLYNN